MSLAPAGTPFLGPADRAAAALAAADFPNPLAADLPGFAVFLACAYLLSSVTLAMVSPQ